MTDARPEPGPGAFASDVPQAGTPPRRGIPLRAVPANVVTALALCAGLTGVRFAVAGEFERAIAMVILAGVLDGLDGRIARWMRGQSRFGAELDSLSDVIAFGVAPAIIMFLWSLDDAPRFGWVACLAYAVAAALRLARFNANIDASEQPHKSAGFLTGVPAPAGAGIAFVPIYAWLITNDAIFRDWRIVLPWMLVVAALLVSSVATFSWNSLRLRARARLFAILFAAMLFAAVLTAPWPTFLAVSVLYVALIPVSLYRYARIKRGRSAAPR